MKNESAKKGKNKKRASPTDLIAEGLELLLQASTVRSFHRGEGTSKTT